MKGKSQSVKDIEKISLYLSTICPINENTEVTMLHRTFVKMCDMHRLRKKGVYFTGFCTKSKGDVNPCENCKTGMDIEAGRKFIPPKKIKLIPV